MIRRTAEGCEQKLWPPRKGTPLRGLHGHEDGVDPCQDAWIRDPQYPAVERSIVHIVQTQVFRLRRIRLPESPGLKTNSFTVVPFVLQVKRIEQEQAAVDVVNATIRATRLAGTVYVIDVNNVQITGTKYFASVCISYEGLGPRGKYRGRAGICDLAKMGKLGPGPEDLSIDIPQICRQRSDVLALLIETCPARRQLRLLLL